MSLWRCVLEEQRELIGCPPTHSNQSADTLKLGRQSHTQGSHVTQRSGRILQTLSCTHSPAVWFLQASFVLSEHREGQTFVLSPLPCSLDCRRPHAPSHHHSLRDPSCQSVDHKFTQWRTSSQMSLPLHVEATQSRVYSVAYHLTQRPVPPLPFHLILHTS